MLEMVVGGCGECRRGKGGESETNFLFWALQPCEVEMPRVRWHGGLPALGLNAYPYFSCVTLSKPPQGFHPKMIISNTHFAKSWWRLNMCIVSGT